MISKLKDYCKKILDKVTESKLLYILAAVGFWEIVFGLACILVTDNIFVEILATIILAMGSIIALGVIGIFALVLLRKAVSGTKALCEDRNFSEDNETTRSKAIKKNNKSNKKIRVGFYCDGGQFWSTFCDLYEMMCSHPKFEPVVIASPETFRNEIYHYDAIAFLEDRKIPYVKGYDDGKWINLKDLKLDYVFYNRHYVIRQPKQISFKEARKYSRICYIPYAICPQVGEIQDILCDFKEMRAFDYMFSENEYMTKIYKQYKNKYEDVITKIETVGSPKFAYAVSNANKEACHDKKYVQSVLYTPRWCFSDGTSSFYDLKDYFFELARNNSDIEYIFRPHPLMKQTIVDEIGQEFWDEFIAEFDKYENAEVDFEVDYMKSFSRASVLVSDLSTMMFEFSVTEKPVIYMYKVDKLNEFGKEAAKGYYYCCSADEVDATLKNLREGNDKYAELRAEISNKLYYNDGVNPSKQICDILLANYK